MEIFSNLFSFFVHLDDHLITILENYGTWTYLILFLIIFCETGLVVTPFLPGDSLLFVIGALTSTGSLDLGMVLGILTLAAILGDTVNYWVGRTIAPKIFTPAYSRFLKPEYLERTQKFFEKYGAKTIIIARFVPIVRTFAPFMAGVGGMNYSRFLFYNVVGGIFWVCSLVLLGYFFGTIPIIKDNLSLATLAIIILSLLPGIYEFWQHHRAKNSLNKK